MNMKSHSPSDAKLLMGGVKGLKDACRLGVLKQEYNRLKRIQDQQQQQHTKCLDLLPNSNRLRDNNNN